MHVQLLGLLPPPPLPLLLQHLHELHPLPHAVPPLLLPTPQWRPSTSAAVVRPCTKLSQTSSAWHDVMRDNLLPRKVQGSVKWTKTC